MGDTKRADAVEAAIRAAMPAAAAEYTDDAAELACLISDATLARVEKLEPRLTVRDDDFAAELWFLRLDLVAWKREAIRTPIPEKALELCVRIGRAASWLESVDVDGIVAAFAARVRDEVAA